MSCFDLRLARTALLAIAIMMPAAASAADPSRTITVQGHGEATGSPDSAQISAGVTTQATTAATALSANAAAMNNVFAALKRMGVTDKNIQTSNFSVEPQYAPYNANNQDRQRIVGYQVSNQVDVTLDHIANVGPAIDALVGAGANQMNGISFTIHDPKPLLADARSAAVADATERAATLAGAARVTLGPILSIEDNASESPRPIRPMMAMAGFAKSAPTPVAAGEQTLSANVTIVWEIQ